MFKCFILLIVCFCVSQVTAINCTAEYNFGINHRLPENSISKCADGVNYCICITGKHKGKTFYVKDCQNTASAIIVSYTNQSRDVSLSCTESANSHFSSGDYSYDYGCSDNNEICSLNILHENNKNLTMNRNGDTGGNGSNSESRITFTLSSLILSAFYYVLKQQ